MASLVGYGLNFKAIPAIEEQDTLMRPASLITAAMANVEERAEYSLSRPIMTDGEDDWTIGDFVEIDAEKRVGEKRRLRNFQESRRVKK